MAMTPTIRALTLAAALAAAASAARAHAILVEGSPANGSTVPAGDVPIALRFNSRVDGERSRLQITDGGGRQTVLPLALGTDAGTGGAGAVLHATAHLAPGRYTIRWQVLAVDGHITRGDVPFTVVGPQAAR